MPPERDTVVTTPPTPCPYNAEPYAAASPCPCTRNSRTAACENAYDDPARRPPSATETAPLPTPEARSWTASEPPSASSSTPAPARAPEKFWSPLAPSVRVLFWLPAIPRKLTAPASSSAPAAPFAPGTVSASDLHSPPLTGNAARSASVSSFPANSFPAPFTPLDVLGWLAAGCIRACTSVTSPSSTSTAGSVKTAPAASTVTAYSPTGSRTTRNSPCAPERARSASPVSSSRATTSAPATGAPAALCTCPPIAPSAGACAQASEPKPTLPKPKPAIARHTHALDTRPNRERPSRITIVPRFTQTRAARRSSGGNSQPRPLDPLHAPSDPTSRRENQRVSPLRPSLRTKQTTPRLSPLHRIPGASSARRLFHLSRFRQSGSRASWRGSPCILYTGSGTNVHR